MKCGVYLAKTSFRLESGRKVDVACPRCGATCYPILLGEGIGDQPAYVRNRQCSKCGCKFNVSFRKYTRSQGEFAWEIRDAGISLVDLPEHIQLEAERYQFNRPRMPLPYGSD